MKRMPVSMVVELIALLLLGATALYGAPDTALRLDYVVVREAPDAQGRPARTVVARTRFIAADGRIRTEDRDANDPSRILSISITNDARDEQISLNPGNKTAVRRRNVKHRASAGIPVIDANIPVRGDKEDLGARTIQGFPCQGYRNTFAQGMQSEHWFCVDPQTGRKFLGSMRAEQPGGSRWWQEDLQRVAGNVPVDSSLFEIPSDYRVVDE
ncbi:MAG TPA: hypothetical protein VNN18_05755 [Candidatus Xenobia bacterium]|nr:hypothetical protein [Candidatus Xenobia bacterium]